MGRTTWPLLMLCTSIALILVIIWVEGEGDDQHPHLSVQLAKNQQPEGPAQAAFEAARFLEEAGAEPASEASTAKTTNLTTKGTAPAAAPTAEDAPLSYSSPALSNANLTEAATAENVMLQIGVRVAPGKTPDGNECLKLQRKPRRNKKTVGALSKNPACPMWSGACCHDGERWGTPCFDVDTCAQSGPKVGKYAFVHVWAGKLVPHFDRHLNFLKAELDQAKAMRAAGNEVDIILLLQDLDGLTSNVKKALHKYKIIVKRAPWALPPAMTWHPKKKNGLFGRPWCGPQDLIRVHVLGLTEYDAVLYLDLDVQVQNDPTNLFRCAAAGHFLSTAGPVRSSKDSSHQVPLNLGIFASRPDKRLVRAAELFAKNITFDRKTGWSGSGYLPAAGAYYGADCGQGYFHTLYYQKPRTFLVEKALRDAGLLSSAGETTIEFKTIDPCIWNYQYAHSCPLEFDCSQVILHHKPLH